MGVRTFEIFKVNTCVQLASMMDDHAIIPDILRRPVMKKLNDNDINAALVERTAAYDIANGMITPIYTFEKNLILQLLQVRDVVIRLARSTAIPFSLPRKASNTDLQHTEIGEQVWQLLLTPIDLATIHYPCHDFDPRIKLFLDCLKKRGLYALWLSAQGVNAPATPPMVDTLNGFVQEIRQRAGSKPFERKLAAFKKQVDQRFKRLQDYFDQLNDAYPASHVLRLAFCYRRFQSVGNSCEPEMNQQVSDHCEELMKRVKNSLGSAFVGHAWKRDYAKDRGFHFHLVVVLNGPQLLELSHIVESFRLQWHEVTTGTGVVYQRYPPLNQAFQHGSQTTTIWDQIPVRTALDPVPTFMVLTDGLIAFAPPGKKTPHGTGQLPKTAHNKKTASITEPEDVARVFTGPFPVIEPTGLI